MNSKFAQVPEKPQFPKEEEKVLAYWKEIKAFETQLEMSKGKPEFTFYDGPPFATGLPHYGHIAAGTIKDVVTRYATMKGHYVSRRFGWDCHGLPIEYEIDKTHKIKSSLDREEMGVEKYNGYCREIVMRYSKEWESIIGRFGRWIDFQNDYKTMDKNYMESVWWTFQQIFKKDLVYRGTKIMPFSTACNTVLSNFEAGSNYKDAYDPAIIVTFPILSGELEGTNLIAWTTTPWTLPSNLACAVNPEFDYVQFENLEDNKKYICLKGERMTYVHKQAKITKHKVLQTFKGAKLVGMQYAPLFNFFEERKADGCFSVIGGSFVTKDAGTGIVHCAPGFGEEDYKVCLAQGLIQPGGAPVPIDQDGCYTSVMGKYAGMYIKNLPDKPGADDEIMHDLKNMGRLLVKGTVKHSYPFCWRSQTPLIYRGFDCWFIKVEAIKEQMIANNKTTRWVPQNISDKRFHNWLCDARDWCFSRNRFWGNPIPIWVSDDGEEVVCIGSIKELQELSGCGEINDLHRETVDKITIPSKQGKGQLKRISEVFDCWFESGSMPFAQSHYPFDVADEDFMKRYPADFIAEGLDQTRGWFYTLMAISTAVKGVAPFQNLIVNGIVLAEDGSKMSKSKQNYPSPLKVADEHGADACRLYLCNSPVVRAEPLRFSKEGVKDIVKDIFLPYFNAYRFLIQNITRYEKRVGQNFVFDDQLRITVNQSADANYMDKWIIAANQNLIKKCREELDNYRLYTVVREILAFLENLTNWYVRLNRPRMKGDEGITAEDQRTSLNTLFDCLVNTSQLLAPICPFISEYVFQNLRNGLPEGSPLNHKSVHWTSYPEFNQELINEDIEATVARMCNAIETGRLIRDKIRIPIKYPLRTVRLVDADPKVLEGFRTVQRYLCEEMNCLNIELIQDEATYVDYSCQPDNKLMGQVLKKKFDKKFSAGLQQLTSEQLKQYLRGEDIQVLGETLQENWLKIGKSFKPEFDKSDKWACAASMVSSVMLDKVLDEELKSVGLARSLTSNIQKLRKDTGISIDDEIEVFYEFIGNANANSALGKVVVGNADKIAFQLKMPFLPMSRYQNHAVLVGETGFDHPDIKNESVRLHVYLACVKFNKEKMAEDFKENAQHCINYLTNLNKKALAARVENGKGQVTIDINGQQVTLVHKQHFYLNGKAQDEQ